MIISLSGKRGADGSAIGSLRLESGSSDGTGDWAGGLITETVTIGCQGR